MGDHMLRREFLFSENNPCDWMLEIIKLTDVKIKKETYIYIYIYIYLLSIPCLTLKRYKCDCKQRFIAPRYRFARGLEAPDVAVKLLSRCKMSRRAYRACRPEEENRGTIHPRPPAQVEPMMIYDEQFGDDGGCAAVAAPVYRRYPISATADGSPIYRSIGCHRYCNSLLIVRRLFDH
jgi:hypothetical protein